MRIKIVLAAVFCLILGAAAVHAQDKAADFSGNWELDVSKSKLSERMPVEAMNLNVTQTDKEISVETKTVRPARPEGDMRGGNGGIGRGGAGRGGMGGGLPGGDGTFTYTLDGKETSAAGDVKLKAKFEKDGKMKLTQTRSFETPMGAVSVKTVETWQLSDEGRTLKINRDMETPRGTQSSELVFVKQ